MFINDDSLSLFLAIVETSRGFRSSCYWTDWNRANTENIRIGLVFAVLDIIVLDVMKTAIIIQIEQLGQYGLFSRIGRL
jgi:hypothetical protein